MINFEEELKKFHPSLEIEEAEDAIYNQDLTDMADILVKMVKEWVDKHNINKVYLQINMKIGTLWELVV